eukprot:SAG31_NODE_3651_length_4025_cov_3.433520_3_plen_185_part_00
MNCLSILKCPSLGIQSSLASRVRRQGISLNQPRAPRPLPQTRSPAVSLFAQSICPRSLFYSVGTPAKCFLMVFRTARTRHEHPLARPGTAPSTTFALSRLLERVPGTRRRHRVRRALPVVGARKQRRTAGQVETFVPTLSLASGDVTANSPRARSVVGAVRGLCIPARTLHKHPMPCLPRRIGH